MGASRMTVEGTEMHSVKGRYGMNQPGLSSSKVSEMRVCKSR